MLQVSWQLKTIEYGSTLDAVTRLLHTLQVGVRYLPLPADSVPSVILNPSPSISLNVRCSPSLSLCLSPSPSPSPRPRPNFNLISPSPSFNLSPNLSPRFTFSLNPDHRHLQSWPDSQPSRAAAFCCFAGLRRRAMLCYCCSWTNLGRATLHLHRPGPCSLSTGWAHWNASCMTPGGSCTARRCGTWCPTSPPSSEGKDAQVYEPVVLHLCVCVCVCVRRRRSAQRGSDEVAAPRQGPVFTQCKGSVALVGSS